MQEMLTSKIIEDGTEMNGLDVDSSKAEETGSASIGSAEPAIDFVYRDTDVAMKEIEEFYSYVEAPQCEQNKAVFDRDYNGIWTDLSEQDQIAYVTEAMKGLEEPDADVRFETLRKLMHVAQGTYGYAESIPHHISMIQMNCRILRRSRSIPVVYKCLKRACARHTRIQADLFDSSDHVDVSAALHLEREQRDALDEANTEIAFYLTLIFQICGASRVTKEDTRLCANELMALEPPFPAYLFGLVADLRERNTRGYPVKKLLLLLWKTLIICLGTSEELSACKKTAQELYGLARETKEPLRPNFVDTKASPLDFCLFREELAAKYPSFRPPEPKIGPVPLDKLAAAMAPSAPKFPDATNATQINGSSVISPVLSTPAPSPPATPANGAKPKKMQFQTPQDMPFVIPFPAESTDDYFAPTSIYEAAALFKDNVRVSKGLIEMWAERERAEGRRFGTTDEELEQRRAHLLTDPDKAADLDKLDKVDMLYRRVLPRLQSVVIVLLKLLLATVTAQSNAKDRESSSDTDSPPSQWPQAETLEALDVRRHREITCKAISGIFLVTLRWFKASHILKFELLSQLLVDSNCLLLILKMYGLQEINRMVFSYGEHEEYKYCATHGSKYPPHHLEHSYHVSGLDANEVLKPTNGVAHHGAYLTAPRTYSWRNMFSLINFTRILQKMTKRKPHRILLLVQYKSSAILKRLLKVPEVNLHLYVLKVLKSQVPYCGRKWRQSNMKIITSIYLICRPDFRDDWIAGIDIESDNQDSKMHEQSLRDLIQYYNDAHFPDLLGSSGQSTDLLLPSTRFGNDEDGSFPPRRPRPSLIASQTGRPMLASLGEVQLDYLQDLHDIIESVFQKEEMEERRRRRLSRSSSSSSGGHSATSPGASKDGRTDPSSIDSLMLEGEGANDENRTDWLHMSPHTIEALNNCPQSPRNSPSQGRRLSNEDLVNLMPDERGGVDEVEYVWEE